MNLPAFPSIYLGVTPAGAWLSWLEVEVNVGSGAGEAWFDTFGVVQLERAYRLACFVLGDSREAEDAIQDAVTQAWRRRDQLRDRERGQAWFDRIVVNACRALLRQRQGVQWVRLDPDSAHGADPFAEALARDELLRALAQLTLEQRFIVVLRYWADLPLAGIAERLGIPLGTVKSRLHYALVAIRTAAEVQT